MNAELKPFDFVLIGYLCLLTLLNWSTMVLVLRSSQPVSYTDAQTQATMKMC